MASAVTPVLLGVTLGAIASGGLAAPPRGGFVDQFVAPWLTPFALAVGIFALLLFAFLAAVYLTLEATDEALCEDSRMRALASAVVAFFAAFGVLRLSHGAAPLVRQGLTTSPGAMPLHAFTGLAAVTAITALWSRRYRVARIAAAAQISLILWGWVLAQYPYPLPERSTIAQAAAPPVTLRLVLGALAVGALVLFPSLCYLFRVFKTESAGAREP